MTNASTANSTFTTDLENYSCMVGKIVRPYLKDGRLVGAVLSFEGKRNTALLHVRQMCGDNAFARLQELSVGDELLVRILIVDEGSKPKVWATEKGVQECSLIEAFKADPEKFKGMHGEVNGTADFGTFINLSGPCAGQTGLVRSPTGVDAPRVKLGSFVRYRKGDRVLVDLAEVKLDEFTGKLLLRLENVRDEVNA